VRGEAASLTIHRIGQEQLRWIMVIDDMGVFIPYLRMESNVRFSKHQILRWLEERSFQPRPVNGKGARRQ